MTKDAQTCQVLPVSYHGWQAIELRNGIVRSVIVPDVGGRIMAFDLGPYAYLWNNRSLLGKLFSPEENAGDGTAGSWKNYGGSKTWPAPQGWETEDQWHGPPDPVLDTGRYALKEAAVVEGWPTAAVVSPPDPRTGMQITRRFALEPGAAHATLHLEMRNASSRPRTWSIWDVVQLDATSIDTDGHVHPNKQAWFYVPTNPASRFPAGYNVMYGAQDNPEWQPDVCPGLFGAQYLFRVGKVGVDSQAGWLAFVNGAGDWAFCARFAVETGATYPDDGATVECWTTGLGGRVSGLDYERNPLYHLEAEVLGPLRMLRPGQVQTLEVEWYVARCPGPIVHVTPLACVHEKLQQQPADGGMRLRGTFGVFRPGRADLVWLGDGGLKLATEALVAVDPTNVLQVDVLREPPQGAAGVDLRLADSGGKDLGIIDHITIGRE
jgi:hypothetical protein